jgi:pimeloyl-ACP methyl ester carboxylesterase
LYFHGKSKWAHGERTLDKSKWKETIKIFLEENDIADFSLVGFSLGGKFALATLESFPEKIKELFLIAPDGIKTNFWYSLATYPFIFRKFFRSMILHPERFLGLARFLNRTGVVDKGLIKFAEYQMNSVEKRNRVYYSWVVFRHLKFNLLKIANLINANNVKVLLIVGKYDKVITPSNMKRFTKMIPSATVEILESGHSGLINQSLAYFLKEE